MKPTLPEASLDQLFRSAHTAHAFTTEAVPDATLHALYELLKWGPTSLNCQPARYIFVRSPAAKERLRACLSPGNVAQTMAAPVTVIIGYDRQFFEHLPVQFPAYDARPMFAGNEAMALATAKRNATLQGAYLILAARSLGLDCGPMSGFDAAKVNAEFFPDGRVQVDFLVNIGVADPAGGHPRGPRLAFDEVAKFA